MLAMATAGFARAGGTDLMAGPGFGQLRKPPRSTFGSVEVEHWMDGLPVGVWGALDVSNEGTFTGLGPAARLLLGSHWTVAASSGPGYCSDRIGWTLGNRLEFRSTAYLFYQMPGDARLGLTLSHYSNAGTARHNPGAETVRLLYAITL